MELNSPLAYKAEMKRRAWAAERKRCQLERCRETAKVTVEVRDLRDSELGCIMRVENRGNVPIGFGAAAHVSHY